MRGSNSDYGFYSPSWENSYNLGLISTDLHFCYHLYNNYRNKLSQLQNIIVFFNIPSPGYSLIHTSERYRVVAYNYFFNIPYLNDKFINPKYEKWINKKCDKLKSINIESDYRGYDKKTYYGTNILTHERIRTHIRENKREPNQLHWLKDLNELIQKDNRKLFIIIPPFRSDYKKLLPEQSIIFKKIFKLKGIEFIDYYNSNKFSDDDFGDADHLNEQGAKKLTNEIYQYFKKNNLL
jgi:hypothetical protein